MPTSRVQPLAAVQGRVAVGASSATPWESEDAVHAPERNGGLRRGLARRVGQTRLRSRYACTTHNGTGARRLVSRL